MQSEMEMKAFVTGLLENQLPANYYYHSLDHTLYVLKKAVEIATAEGCSSAELRLLSTAALWHDVGHIHIYAGHEAESCKLARQYLPSFGFIDPEIARICGMIMATKIPQSPTNNLEEIIADADLEYLGTENAGRMSEILFKELQTLNPHLTRTQWNKQQINFLKNHHYFTRYCKDNIEQVKAEYLHKLQTDINAVHG